MYKILVIGAAGQIGSELTVALRRKYGNEHVVAGIHQKAAPFAPEDDGLEEVIDCRDAVATERVVRRHSIDTIFHLAALLSARGEQQPQQTWKLNIDGLLTVLEVARLHNCAVFFPSSIGAFGPATPKEMTPQNTIQRPATMYGISKVTGELLCEYYHLRYGLDIRGIRFPGIVSYKTAPGGGTTDYAVEIFHAAISKKQYSCYLQPGTFLDMMYMPDAISAAMQLMEADPTRLQHRNAYNLTAMSVDPQMLAMEIKKRIPAFIIDYQVDPVRQRIADSWPDSLDDSSARNDWDWQPRFDLPAMVDDMLGHLSRQHGSSQGGAVRT